MALEPGQIIDAKYRVVRRIGEGGMGTVYEGENSRIGRRVAIKVLHAQVAAMPEFVERFEREARAAARIGSPYVCDVLDLGDLPSGDRYIVMEYLDGVSFEERIANGGKLTCAQLAPIAFELLEGLATMHGARVIHRDLKPANVFLSRTNGGRGEVVKILDFGVAKLLPLGGEVGTMTQTGTMMGTPLYMSPEQARGARDVDGRTDIYAASVMFYRALTGVLPYNAETLNELLFKIVLEDPRPLREVAPEVDEVFAEMVHKGLARDLNQRYESARDYQDAIAAWGRAQGRQSLAFAVTSSIDGAMTSTSNSSSANASRPASTPGSHAGGTPIAWSEDARSARIPSGVATVMDRVGAPSSTGSPSVGKETPESTTPATTRQKDAPAHPAAAAAVAAAARSSVDGSAAPATSTLASSLTRSPGSAAEPPIAIATTLAEVTKDAKGGAASKRGLAIGVAAAGALAIVGFLAFGRGGSPTTSGLVPGAPTAPASTQGNPPTPAVHDPAASAASASSTVPTATAATAEPPASAASTTAPPPATVPARHDLNGGQPGTPRRNDASVRGTSAVALTGAAPTTAPPPPASAAAPKPASSGRKFRTNID